MILLRGKKGLMTGFVFVFPKNDATWKLPDFEGKVVTKKERPLIQGTTDGKGA